MVHNKEATMAAITETPIQDVQVGDRILSPADGRIWVSDAVFQDNHGTYTLVLTRDAKSPEPTHPLKTCPALYPI